MGAPTWSPRCVSIVSRNMNGRNKNGHFMKHRRSAARIVLCTKRFHGPEDVRCVGGRLQICQDGEVTMEFTPAK
jgi:hypothetical protein